MFWKIAVPAVIGLTILTAVEAGDSPDQTKASTVTTTTTVVRPGSPAVYAGIAVETDCDSLQASFDRAELTSKRPGGTQNLGTWRQIGIAYMEAADARMKAIDCY